MHVSATNPSTDMLSMIRNIERAVATRSRPHLVDHRACCALRIDRRLEQAAKLKRWLSGTHV